MGKKEARHWGRHLADRGNKQRCVLKRQKASERQRGLGKLNITEAKKGQSCREEVKRWPAECDWLRELSPTFWNTKLNVSYSMVDEYLFSMKDICNTLQSKSLSTQTRVQEF